MCGIVGIVTASDGEVRTNHALDAIAHRGPDARATWSSPDSRVVLGHARLSIIDLSTAGTQPMSSTDGRVTLAFNGELYNYLELRAELADYPFRTQTDTEVVLAAWSRWGERCLDRFLGMFAFLLWDQHAQQLIAVRDRFGVKPLFIGELPGGGVVLASEIKAAHAAGIPRELDVDAWASFLVNGTTDQPSRTTWRDVAPVPAGSLLRIGVDGKRAIERWYDLATRVSPDDDQRPLDVVRDEYLALLRESVALRFRSDVPVGINLSGGLDSSLLLGLVHAVQGPDSAVSAFTFTTGDPSYDELPWVRGMLERTQHPLIDCRLRVEDVPALAARIAHVEDEPFGGIPTLAYAGVFAKAREHGVIVLLDGQGLDEQWAGYDYYRTASAGSAPTVQGTRDPTTRVDCLTPELVERARGAPAASTTTAFTDTLRNLQLRDATVTKLPRALRYNDRISMASSTELREPFLDHRLFELALRQPRDRKIRGDTGKWLVRELASSLLPDEVRLAPKRSVQTPQREWLRGPLREWADGLVESALADRPDWFDRAKAREAWRAFQSGAGDNSYWVWQWMSLALLRR
jgi:asparagine synthase (glutamine-hydrolysing)